MVCRRGLGEPLLHPPGESTRVEAFHLPVNCKEILALYEMAAFLQKDGHNDAGKVAGIPAFCLEIAKEVGIDEISEVRPGPRLHEGDLIEEEGLSVSLRRILEVLVVEFTGNRLEGLAEEHPKIVSHDESLLPRVFQGPFSLPSSLYPIGAHESSGTHPIALDPVMQKTAKAY
jgi:hypothetical protein